MNVRHLCANTVERKTERKTMTLNMRQYAMRMYTISKSRLKRNGYQAVACACGISEKRLERGKSEIP
jgi:hypothetical protein